MLLAAADVNKDRDKFDAEHKLNKPGHALSVVWNVAGTHALVKIAARDEEVERLKLKDGQHWTRGTHAEIFSWFYTPAWQPG